MLLGIYSIVLSFLNFFLKACMYIFDVYKYYFSSSAFSTSSCLSLTSCHYSSFSSIKKALTHFLFDWGGVKLLITMKPEHRNNSWGFHSWVHLTNFYALIISCGFAYFIVNLNFTALLKCNRKLFSN